MAGAADMAARAAMRAGAGTVRLGIPGQPPSPRFPEVVGRWLPEEGWDEDVVAGELDRMKAVVMGPGLGRSGATAAAVRRLVARAKAPMLLDADALFALGSLDDPARFLRTRPGPTVLTPHDGEAGELTVVGRENSGAGAPAHLRGPPSGLHHRRHCAPQGVDDHRGRPRRRRAADHRRRGRPRWSSTP